MLKKLKKLSLICVLSLVLVSTQPTPSYAVGSIFKLIGKFFDEIANIFKSESTVVTKIDNPDLKSFEEQAQEVFKSAQSNPLDEVTKTKSAAAVETANQGSIEMISGLKKDQFLLKFQGIRKIKADNLLEIADLQEYFEDIFFEDTKKTSKFFSFQKLNWSGRIYRAEEYYKKPKLDKKMLLECHFNQDIFYLFIILEDKIKEAILDEHISKSRFFPKLKKQRLAVLVDENDLKIMSTFPENDDEFPRNYFILKNNQDFTATSISKENNPKDMIKLYRQKTKVSKTNNNQCFKVLKSGLIKE